MKFSIFLNVYIFENLLILNALYQKYIANINSAFTKWCFALWFYNFIKKMVKKKKKEMIKTRRRKTKQYYHNTGDIISDSDICRWKRDSCSSEVKITRGSFD